MKLYCPPERGIIALSSAKVSAPPSVRIPATRYAKRTIHGVPTLHVMTRALTKTPVPITLVTIRAVAGMSVRPLISVAELRAEDWLSDTKFLSVMVDRDECVAHRPVPFYFTA